jgi:hypothetical protein
MTTFMLASMKLSATGHGEDAYRYFEWFLATIKAFPLIATTMVATWGNWQNSATPGHFAGAIVQTQTPPSFLGSEREAAYVAEIQQLRALVATSDTANAFFVQQQQQHAYALQNDPCQNLGASNRTPVCKTDTSRCKQVLGNVRDSGERKKRNTLRFPFHLTLLVIIGYI